MERKAAKSNFAVARIAERQHGVVTSWQMLEAGLSEAEIFGRAASGQYHRIHQSVYAIGHPALSDRGRWLAAVLACVGLSDRRESAFLSHQSAAALWQMLPDRTQGRTHVVVQGRNGRARRRDIKVHWSTTLRPGDTGEHDGIPVTSPGRTIRDLRRTRRSERLSPAELRRAERQASVLGLALDELRPERTRSELERLFLDLCRRHRLPVPEVNVRIWGFEVDFLWRDRGVVVETDGYRFHRGRLAFEEDRKRDLVLRNHDLDVVRLAYSQVTDEPAQVAGSLRALLLPSVSRISSAPARKVAKQNEG